MKFLNIVTITFVRLHQYTIFKQGFLLCNITTVCAQNKNIFGSACWLIPRLFVFFHFHVIFLVHPFSAVPPPFLVLTTPPYVVFLPAVFLWFLMLSFVTNFYIRFNSSHNVTSIFLINSKVVNLVMICAKNRAGAVMMHNVIRQSFVFNNSKMPFRKNS